MNIPVENGDPVNFLVLLLRVPRRYADIVEKTETHRSIRCGMVAWRPDGYKRILYRALDHRVDCATCGSGAAQGSFK